MAGVEVPERNEALSSVSGVCGLSADPLGGLEGDGGISPGDDISTVYSSDYLMDTVGSGGHTGVNRDYIDGRCTSLYYNLSIYIYIYIYIYVDINICIDVYICYQNKDGDIIK